MLLQAAKPVIANPDNQNIEKIKAWFETVVAAIVIFTSIIAIVRWFVKRIKIVKEQIDTNYIHPFNVSVEKLRTHVEESQAKMDKRWDETDKLLTNLAKGYASIDQMKEDIKKISGEIMSASGGSIKDKTDQIQKDVSQLTNTMNAMLYIDSNAIMINNNKGECVQVNQEWLILTGFPSQEMAMGHGWYNAIHPDDREAVISQWEDSVESSSQFISNFRVQNRQTKTIYMVASKATSTKDHLGRTINIIVVFIVKNK